MSKYFIMFQQSILLFSIKNIFITTWIGQYWQLSGCIYKKFIFQVEKFISFIMFIRHLYCAVEQFIRDIVFWLTYYWNLWRRKSQTKELLLPVNYFWRKSGLLAIIIRTFLVFHRCDTTNKNLIFRNIGISEIQNSQNGGTKKGNFEEIREILIWF